MRKSLAVIHTVVGLVPIFDELISLYLPRWQAFNILDESLLSETIRRGQLTANIMRRATVHIWNAIDAGADAVLVTCSSIGPAIDAAVPYCPVPLVRIDEGMAATAVRHGSRIGVIATLGTTLEPTCALLTRQAGQQGRVIEILPRLCTDAFDALKENNYDKHNSIAISSVQQLTNEADVIVLAQASIARILNRIEKPTVPILSSPELGIRHLAYILEGHQSDTA